MNYKETKNWLEQHVNNIYFPKDIEFTLLNNLLNNHPNKEEWKYQTPLSFKISRSPGNGAVVMYVRFEGTKKYRIVSWVSCAKGKTNYTKDGDNQLVSSMRYAVRQQIQNYRKSNSVQICCLCKSLDRIEVDHYPTHFSEIKQNFVEMKQTKNELPPTEFKWHPKRGNFMFKNGTKANNYYDKRWKQSWQRYHKTHASYRYLCSSCNKKTNQN